MAADDSTDSLQYSSGADDAALLWESVRLPCGRTVPNRMCKVAMYESLADFGGGLPNEKHFRLYSRWGQGRWGMIITGNAQVDQQHLSLGRDLVIPQELTPETIAPYYRLAQCIHQSGAAFEMPLAIMQLNHTGRQAPRIVGGCGLTGTASAPSAVPVRSRDGKDGIIAKIVYHILFPTPIELKDNEIDIIIESFVRGARVANEAGFDGVQIHCAHGYLLAQFLSPKTNLRHGQYGFPNELHVLHEIIRRIRSAVPLTFVVGVKVNAADYVHGGLGEETALAHVQGIAAWGMVDFIEISGGDYERSEFGDKANSRQAFFSRFSRVAMEALPHTETMPMILLTGSLRTQRLMAHSIRARHANLIGIGRPSVLYPNYARIILRPGQDQPPVTLNPSGSDSAGNHIHYEEPSAPAWLKVVNTSLIGAGIGTAWHCALMGRIAAGRWAGLKSRSGEEDAALSIEEVRATPLTRNEMPRIGGIRSLVEMWSP